MVFFWYDKGLTSPVTYSPQERRVDAIPPIKAAKGSKTAEKDDSESKRQEATQAYERILESTAEERPTVLAKEIASSPVESIDPERLISDAMRLFKDRRFRQMPVVDGAGNLLGIVSDRDLLKEVVSSAFAGAERAVGDLMNRRVLTARPEASLREVARILFEEKVGSIVILDDLGSMVGIVTRSDVLRALVHRAPIEIWS